MIPEFLEVLHVDRLRFENTDAATPATPDSGTECAECGKMFPFAYATTPANEEKTLVWRLCPGCSIYLLQHEKHRLCPSLFGGMIYEPRHKFVGLSQYRTAGRKE